jgi:Ser/Thr protein kinase RdoA (MazF antagonist)
MTADLTDLARTAAAAFDLPTIVGVELLEGGNNTAFQVTTADRNRSVLRVHRPGYRTTRYINSELRFVRHLYDSGVPVPQPIYARDGRLVVEVGQRFCDMLTWVDGDVLLTDGGLDADAVHQLGRTCGLMHNAAARFVPPDDFDLPRWDAAGMFTAQASPFRPQLDLDELLSTGDRVAFDDIAQRTRAVFDAISGDDSFGVIHGDYILGNCHLRRSEIDWHVGVFDFDDCGWGYYLYDLCPLLANLAGYPGAIRDNPDYPALRAAYLDGYRTVRELPVEWEKHLPVLMAARNANHVFWPAGLDVSPTPREDAVWRMGMARRCLELPV